MKRYPSRLEGAHTAPERCVELLQRSQPRAGILLDLGCGRAPLADAVRDLGLEYVGVDVDAEALAEVEERGFETHRIDLGGGEEQLREALGGAVAGRDLSAMLAVDLLEHLVHPDALLRAARGLVPEGQETPLIVSIPNVTHVDVAAKLLLGRWDLTDWGLLDDTHLRFFSEPLLAELFRASGWTEVDAADVVSPESEQLFPRDAPPLHPGTPARELLRRLRSESAPHGDTYQFVRRFDPGEAGGGGPHRWAGKRDPEAERVFASILIRSTGEDGAAMDLLRADLAAQTVDAFETVFVDASGGEDAWDAAISSAQGRYLCFLDDSVRVSPLWIEAFQASSRDFPGRVLRAAAVAAGAQRLSETKADRLFDGAPLPINPLDLLHRGRPGPTILPAYAVPAQAARSSGIRFEQSHGPAAATVFLSRLAELCGVAPVSGITVAVVDTAANDGEADLDAVAEALDGAPLILPPGSASQLIDLRRALTQTQESFSWRLTKPLRSVKGMRRRGRS